MAKSYVQESTEVYLSILRDVLYAYPSLGSELSKDESRLIHLITQRGLPFLMVDLPALGKHLDRCVAEGQYKLSGLPGSHRVSERVVIPKLFRGLYLLIFNEDGSLKGDIDVQALKLLRQLLYGAKRARYQCSERNVAREIDAFFETDCRLPHPSPWWAADFVEDASIATEFPGFTREQWYVSKVQRLPEEGSHDPPTGQSGRCSDEKLLAMFGTVADLVASTLGPYRFGEWKFRHGPGAVSDVRPGGNRYRFHNWSDRLEDAFPLADCAFHSLSEWADVDIRLAKMTADEPSSKLVAVPKTLLKPRLIATEPSEHMWCQQNVKHFMYQRVRETWLGAFVKFDDQSQNQDLCRLGSMDGSLVTVDLSAASDCVSCHCVGNFFRRNASLLKALRSTRTRFVTLGGDDATRSELRKYSTMGNATTFPVETLIFLTCALAASLVSKKVLTPPRDWNLMEEISNLAGRVSVFGDDIIAPKDDAMNLLRLLEILDFKVNVNKSFLTGLFRESCGVDAYAGVEITPAYWLGPCLEGNPESVMSMLEVSNNFYQKWLINTSAHVQQTIEGRFRNWPVVSMDSGVTGFKSFVRPTRAPSTRVRWNAGLQRFEARCLSLKVEDGERVEVGDGTDLLRYFTVPPVPYERHTPGLQVDRPVVKITHRWVDVNDFCPEGPYVNGDWYGNSNRTEGGVLPERDASFLEHLKAGRIC